jgi:two-component system, NtrC family, sensor histidine kinase HydH
LNPLLKRLASAVTTKARIERLIPTWKSNFLIVGVIIAVVLAYFLWEISRAQRVFIAQVKIDTQIISEAIQLNANNALISEAIIDEIVKSFLDNSARFIDFLDAIEPLSESELSAFCRQSNLEWAIIYRPQGLTRGQGFDAADGHTQPKMSEKTSTLKRGRLPGSISVGFSSPRIDTLKRQIDLKQTLQRLQNLSGITYIRIDKTPVQGSGRNFGVILNDDKRIAETQLSMSHNKTLVVGVSASPYYYERDRLWTQFVFFTILAGCIGALVSWLLYYYQTTTLKQALGFERSLARQQEDSALGQATATITHELRNPLNAISMGLQRLSIEAEELTSDHKDLVDTMIKALHRTNGIIGNLSRYTRSLKPQQQQVDINTTISRILILYQGVISKQGLDVIFNSCSDATLIGDQHLLEEMLENLIKNATEAQQEGGYICIEVTRQGDMLVIELENKGFEVSNEKTDRIFEPYFTTKSKGSGLGLAIAKRIIEAHGGSISGHSPDARVLRLSILLPLNPASKEQTGGNAIIHDA